MQKFERIFGYVGAIAIVLLLFGLGGWYFFLSRQTAAIEGADKARGFSIGIPSFSSSRGSNSANSETSNVIPGVTGTSDSALKRFLGIGTPARLTTNDANTSDASATASSDGTEATHEAPQAPRFWRVNLAPVAGAAFIGSKLRYVERATGYVFDVDTKTGEITRITNTLIPKVYKADIGGNNVVIEHTIQNGEPAILVGTISTSTEDGFSKLVTRNLGGDLDDIAILTSESDILTLAERDQVHLIQSRADGTKPVRLMSIPAGDFAIHWISAKSIVLAERPASGIPGSAYTVGTTLTSLLRMVPGLTVLPNPTSDTVVYGSDTGSELRLFADLNEAGTIELPVKTIADKCVWAPHESIIYCAVPDHTIPNFLTRWLRGEVHSADEIYTVSVSGNSAKKIFTPDSGFGIDVENIRIDETGEHVAFINARDKSLWMLRIKE